MKRTTPSRFQPKSEGEETFALHCGIYKIPYEREACLIPGRKWRVDFLIDQPLECADGSRIVVEIEGGTWMMGRHQRGQGYENDARKYNALTLAGYRVFRFTTGMVQSGEAIDTVRKLLE